MDLCESHPQLASGPGALDLRLYAPLILTPEDLSRAIGRLHPDLAHQLSTPAGRLAWVHEALEVADAEGLSPEARSYWAGAAGHVAVTLSGMVGLAVDGLSPHFLSGC